MSDLFNDRRRTPSEINAANQRAGGADLEKNPHQLGDCKDCGRRSEHKWHTEPGYGSIGDGMVPHVYNPKGEKFKHLLPKGEPGLTAL